LLSLVSASGLRVGTQPKRRQFRSLQPILQAYYLALSSNWTCGDAASRSKRACCLTDVHGPDRTFTVPSVAAVQLPRTGHSCIVQHFQESNAGPRNEAIIGLSSYWFVLKL
jgi:hypothetical protein